MSNVGKMLTDWQKPFGGGLPCSILRKEGKNLPFLYCNASWYNKNEGEREYLPAIASYTPNIEHEFQFWAEPTNDPGDGAFADDTNVKLRIGNLMDERKRTSIHKDALEIQVTRINNHGYDPDHYPDYCIGPKAHCERLAYFSNMSATSDIALPKKFGWIGPDRPGPRTNMNFSSPPIPFGKSLWRRTVSHNFNPAIASKEFPQSTIDQGYGYKLDKENVHLPGFDDPHRAAALWAWAPSLLKREGDFVMYDSPGCDQSTSGFTWRIDYPFRFKDWNLVSQWPVYLRPDTYDWRFFYAMVSRRTWERSATHILCRTDWYPMWWRFSPFYNTPHGLKNTSLMRAIYKIAYGTLYDTVLSTLPELVPRNTFFDARVQACVYSLRLGTNIIPTLQANNWNLVQLAGAQNHDGARFWNHTQYYVKIRQSMPIMAPL